MSPIPPDLDHNPDKITPEQLGADWRLLTEKEVRCRKAREQYIDFEQAIECWSLSLPVKEWCGPAWGTDLRYTYRTNRPKGYWLNY